MAEEFEPVTLYKNGDQRLAQSQRQLVQLEWDGWSREDKSAKKAAEKGEAESVPTEAAKSEVSETAAKPEATAKKAESKPASGA
jgi:hypothetical protein